MYVQNMYIVQNLCMHKRLSALCETRVNMVKRENSAVKRINTYKTIRVLRTTAVPNRCVNRLHFTRLKIVSKQFPTLPQLCGYRINYF